MRIAKGIHAAKKRSTMYYKYLERVANGNIKIPYKLDNSEHPKHNEKAATANAN